MKPQIEQIIVYFQRWTLGGDTQFSENGQQLTLPLIGTVSQVRLNKSMLILRTVLISLLVIQGLRSGMAVLHSHSLLSAMAIEETQSPGDKMRESIDAYNPILDKGILGVQPKQQTQQLFGILGKSALFGTSGDNAKSFEVGAVSPGDE